METPQKTKKQCQNCEKYDDFHQNGECESCWTSHQEIGDTFYD